MNSDLMYIGNRIREEREKQGMSQERLAEDAGVSSNAISNLENGLSNFKVGTLLGIMDSLGATANDLLPERFSQTEEMEARLFRVQIALNKLSEDKRSKAMEMIEGLVHLAEL